MEGQQDVMRRRTARSTMRCRDGSSSKNRTLAVSYHRGPYPMTVQSAVPPLTKFFLRCSWSACGGRHTCQMSSQVSFVIAHVIRLHAYHVTTGVIRHHICRFPFDIRSGNNLSFEGWCTYCRVTSVNCYRRLSFLPYVRDGARCHSEPSVSQSGQMSAKHTHLNSFLRD